MKPLIPWHWSLSGPSKAYPAEKLFRFVNARAGHVATIRRVLRVGPWALYLCRYRPGNVDE